MIRTHPVGAFLLWFFTAGQTIAFTPLIARWGFGADLPTEPFPLTATFIGLVLPMGLVAIASTRGRLGLDASTLGSSRAIGHSND